MVFEPDQPPGRAGKQQLPVHEQQAIAGSEETTGSDLLEPLVGDNVRTLRAVLKVSQAVLGARRLSDALEVIAEQTRPNKYIEYRVKACHGCRGANLRVIQ